MALEYNQAAYFPIVLSLIKLHLRSLWYIATGGRQPNLILWGDDGDDDHWWPSKLWRTDPEHDETVNPMEDPGHQHKPNTPVGIMDEDQDDPVARARKIREQQARADEDNDPGEDFYDGMTIRRGAGDGEGIPPGDEEFWESVVLAFLLVGIAGLMWLRGRYVLRREEEERRRRQEIQAAEQRERQREQQRQIARDLDQAEDDNEGEAAPPNAPLQPQPPGAGEQPAREALQPHMAMFM
jgi:SEL1 protein